MYIVLTLVLGLVVMSLCSKACTHVSILVLEKHLERLLNTLRASV